MGQMLNLGAGLVGGFIAGRQAKERRAREEKQDKMYDAILQKMAIGGADKAKTPAAPPVPADQTSSNALPVLASNENRDVKKEVTQEGEPFAAGGMVKYANGGMVGAHGNYECQLPMGDKMAWQRQSFKK